MPPRKQKGAIFLGSFCALYWNKRDVSNPFQDLFLLKQKLTIISI